MHTRTSTRVRAFKWVGAWKQQTPAQADGSVKLLRAPIASSRPPTRRTFLAGTTATAHLRYGRQKKKSCTRVIRRRKGRRLFVRPTNNKQFHQGLHTVHATINCLSVAATVTPLREPVYTVWTDTTRLNCCSDCYEKNVYMASARTHRSSPNAAMLLTSAATYFPRRQSHAFQSCRATTLEVADGDVRRRRQRLLRAARVVDVSTSPTFYAGAKHRLLLYIIIVS